MIKNENSAPQLVELAMRLVDLDDESGHKSLNVDVRVGKDEFETENAEITVQIKRLHVELHMQGREIVTKSRYGDVVKENRIDIKTAITREEKIGTEVSAKGAASALASGGIGVGASASGSVSGSKSSTFTKKESFDPSESFYRVRAVPGNRWEIKELGDAPLDGTYLDDQALCKLKKCTAPIASS